MEASVISQLGYCPLVWMFHSRGLNNKKIICVNEYGDKSSSFQNLLRRGNSVFIHHRNTQAAVSEVIKVKNNNIYQVMREIFVPKISPYNDHNNNSFQK